MNEEKKRLSNKKSSIEERETIEREVINQMNKEKAKNEERARPNRELAPSN